MTSGGTPGSAPPRSGPPDLVEAVEAWLDGLVRRIGAEPPGTALAPDLELVALAQQFVDDDRRRARVLYVEALGNEALNRRRISAGHDITSFIETDSVERRGSPPDGEHIVALTSAVLVGGISEVLTTWLDGRLDVTRDELIGDLTELFVGLTDTAFRLATGRITRAAEPS